MPKVGRNRKGTGSPIILPVRFENNAQYSSPWDWVFRRSKLSDTVLIIDDAEFMRVMLADIVEDMGMKVVGQAADGQEGFDAFNELCPDLTLLDITMPTMDGLDALKMMMTTRSSASVVMITALGQKDQVLASIKAGARDFIIKPFDQERVQETLSRLQSPCGV